MLVGKSPRSSGPRGARTELEDAELVVLAQSQDVAAYEVLYRRHAGYVMSLAVRIQGSVVDVEDIVHDAFLKAHEQLGELRDPPAFRGWLGAIVVRLVATRMRRRRLLERLGLAVGEPVEIDAIAAAEASPEDRAQLAQLYALLQTVPAGDRIAWMLRTIERHPLDEVARLCRCSLATAKRRISRAQRFLSSHFVAAFPGEAT
ncbi:MAG: RNA polymerase sigma factor [Polyangiaceae bacterium]|nr:RNA polymerase sigma factor [Polyangiaceae bacterium]